MAGTPQKRRAFAVLEEQGEEAVFSRIAAGEFVKVVCEDLGVSPALFYRWVNDEPERKALYDEMREAQSHGLVEDAIRIVDEGRKDAKLTNAQANLTKETARNMQWLAGRINRKDYGDSPLVNINAENIGELHLDALRQHGRVEPQPEPESELIEAEAEVVEDEIDFRQRSRPEKLGDLPDSQ